MKINLFLYFLYSRLKLLYILSAFFISMQELSHIQAYLSEIKLVIKGTGNSYFLNNTFYSTPSEVIINGETIDTPENNMYNFEEEINYVTIKFNNQIESCENMFSGLANIIEIDLSNFDTSRVTNMYSMFLECSNLERINFGNINTSSVKNMDWLFLFCTKLTSINLSNFDTSSVTSMWGMFSGCESLTSIDASKFDTHNVENMFDMFCNCHNLITVNVSNFNTSKVKMMRGIFWCCHKLKFLDISSFDYSSVTNMNYTFEEDSSLVYIKFTKLNLL